MEVFEGGCYTFVMAKTEKQVKFEDAIGQVEAIVEQIESGEVGLEQSLAKYEQGMKLLGDCRGILDKAEKRIAQLKVEGKGKVKIKIPGGDKSSDGSCAVEEEDQGRLI